MLTFQRCALVFCMALALMAGCASKRQLSVPPSPDSTTADAADATLSDSLQLEPAVQAVTRWVHSRTNIRADRSTKSEIVGKLEADQAVRAAFLEDEWFAVFSLDQEVSAESMALGYVYAPLLKSAPASEVAETVGTATQTEEQPEAAPADAPSPKPSPERLITGEAAVLGCWIDEVSMGITCTLRRQGGELILEQQYSDGSSSMKAVFEQTQGSATRYTPKTESISGDYYLLGADGVLEFWDKEGLIVRLQACP